jgi:hypothetical protein
MSDIFEEEICRHTYRNDLHIMCSFSALRRRTTLKAYINLTDAAYLSNGILAG